MESYQETVLSATKLSFFLISIDIGEIPVGAHLLLFLVSYLESLLITEDAVFVCSTGGKAQFRLHSASPS